MNHDTDGEKNPIRKDERDWNQIQMISKFLLEETHGKTVLPIYL